MNDSVRVLHVDDDPAFADLTTAFLERQDDRFSVATATDPDEGLSRLDAETFDCVVSDHDMPGRTGIEFLRAVRETYPDIPFILFTGKGSEEVAGEAISAGVTDYLRKRSGDEQYELLATRIANAVSQYRTERELERQNELFRKAQDIADVGAWELYPQTGEGSYTQGVYDIYGIESRAGGDPEADIQEFYHPDDRGRLRTAVERAVANAEPYDIEVRVRDADDTRKWVRTRGEPEVVDGEVVRLRGTIQDITDRKERERELGRTSDFLERIQEIATIGGWQVDFRTDDVRWTDAVYDIHGVSTDYEPTVEGAIGFYHPAEESRIRRLFGRLRENEEPYDAELRIVDADGDLRWIRSRGVPWYEDGEFVGVRGSVREITDRKRREAELERSRELLRHTERLAGTGGWEVDPDSRERRWTDGTYAIHGVDPDADLDASVESAIEFYHPDDRDEIRRAIEGCMRGGGPFETELRLVTPEGRIKWVHVTGEAVFEDGEPTAVRGAIQDVTDRREREAQLIESRERLQVLFDAAPSEIKIHDEEGRLHEVNDQHVEKTGYDREELLEMNVADYEVGVDLPELKKIWTGMSVGDAMTVEGTHRRRDGSTYPVEVRVSKTEIGSETRFLAFSRDITDRKEREADLRGKNERLETFAGVVSHDLQNPLNVAGGRLELASEECDSDHLDDAATAIERSQALVKDLITLARTDDFESTPPTPLGEVVRDCWEEIGADGAELRIRTDASIRANRRGLERLIENVLRNSVEHASTGSGSESHGDGNGAGAADALIVTLGDLPDGFYVEDDGPGIPPENREKAFEAGFSTASDGTGFGLRIVGQVADAHGWEVDIRDGADGGTRVAVTGVEPAE